MPTQMEGKYISFGPLVDIISHGPLVTGLFV